LEANPEKSNAIAEHQEAPKEEAAERKERWNTDRLLGTSSLKDGSMWHICSKQELWSQWNSHC
jgi:hypothetical protein